MKSLRIGFFAMLLLGIAAIFAAPYFASDAPIPDKVVEAGRFNNLGVAYMNQQLFAKALTSFEQASKLDPSMQIAKLNRGIALLNLQRIDDAKAALQKAVTEDPKDPHGWYNLGLFYKNSSDSENAIKAFQEVVELVPNDADSWYFLGSTYVQAKQYAAAIEAFEHALRLNPLHASAEFGLSRAYQQSGDSAKARQHLQKFEYIKDNKLGAPMSLAYGEQGQYSRAEESPAIIEKAPPEIKVQFVDATKESGIETLGAAGEAKSLASFLGSGACFLDYDGDGKIDLLVAAGGPQGGIGLYHNLGSGKFEDVTKKAGLDPAQVAIGCAAGDYDNDGATDLALSSGSGLQLFHNDKNGTFKDVTAAAGIKAGVAPAGLTFVDYDHDGDLDLYVTPDTSLPISGRISGENLLWRNNGNGTFTDVTGAAGLKGETLTSAAIGSDYNNDRAVDLVLSGGSPRLQDGPTPALGTAIYENPREGKFIKRELWSSPLPSTTVAIAILDFNHDGWMDVAFTHPTAPGVTLWKNNGAKSFDVVKLPALNWSRAFGVAAFDYDNDGWVDLVAVGETKDGKGAIRLFRNLGPDGFKDVTADVGLDRIHLKDPRAVIVGDYDGDGANDLLITQNHGPVVLLRNEGGNQNHWLRLALRGLNDNKSAIGTKVEVFAGATRQKYEIYGSSGYLGQNSPQLLLGLGQNKQADVVRMLWPTGVLQDEVEIAANREQPYLEIDRRGSSCPTLFVWDGERYQLVDDMIGAGVVGHWVGPNERNVPRPAEYIKLDRKAIHLRDGEFSFHLTEPMEEAVYLDQVKLLAVDHPSKFDVFPNEYFASNPPYPKFRVIQSRGAELPAAAHDEHGHDLLPSLRAHKYVGDFGLLPFHGFAKTHSMELDLGAPYQGGSLILLMHGVTEYYTATSVYAAHQANVESIPPYVEAQDAHGRWVRAVNDMGFPAGGPRTITANLSGKLPLGTKHIRITTNLQVYWDSIRIDRAPQDGAVELHEVPLRHAELTFHGFPRMIEGQPKGNLHYVYEEVSPTGPYAHQAGNYTRYGDVFPLLTSFDDRLVVFGPGDDISLQFSPAGLPALPEGWSRDYFFLVKGYEKDMDFYAADGFTVDPLPFQSMGSYPYPGKSYPLDAAHLNYLLEYNTRYVSGNEARGYSYQFPAGK
jgi:tetratricopeptide (TPR) repeat protein